MHIRPYRSSDCPALAELFYQTVHTVCARDYSPEQLDAWADGRVELAAWDASFRAHDTRVAEEAVLTSVTFLICLAEVGEGAEMVRNRGRISAMIWKLLFVRRPVVFIRPLL